MQGLKEFENSTKRRGQDRNGKKRANRTKYNIKYECNKTVSAIKKKFFFCSLIIKWNLTIPLFSVRRIEEIKRLFQWKLIFENFFPIIRASFFFVSVLVFHRL